MNKGPSIFAAEAYASENDATSAVPWTDRPPWWLDRGGKLLQVGQGPTAAYLATVERPLWASNTRWNAREVGSLGLRWQSEGHLAELIGLALKDARADGIDVLYAAVAPADIADFAAHGFVARTTGTTRNLVLGSASATGALGPVRRVAEAARRLRPKLVDVPLDASRLQMFAELLHGSGEGVRLHKTNDYLQRRYASSSADTYRAVVYRSRAGQAIQSLAVLRNFSSPEGKRVVHLEDYWTRRSNRRDLAKLLGEIALMSFGAGVQALRSFAVRGSLLEAAIAGPWRTKLQLHIMVLPLNDDLAQVLDAATELELHTGDLELYTP